MRDGTVVVNGPRRVVVRGTGTAAVATVVTAVTATDWAVAMAMGLALGPSA